MRRFLSRRQPAARPRAVIVRQTVDYEPQIRREAEALVDAGFEVEFLCMRNPERPARTRIGAVDVTSLPCALGRSSRLRYALDYCRFFLLAAGTLTLRHLRRPYAVVQVNTMPDFLVFAGAVPKWLGARLFAYMHEPVPELAEALFGPGAVARALARIEQRALAFADHAFAVTEQHKQRCVERGARADRITVVLNGVDPRIRLGGWTAPTDGRAPGFTAICHGAVMERYGQDTIIDAAALLRDELPELRVVLTGRGTMAGELPAMIAARGLGKVVRFEGWVSHDRMNDLLHGADVGIVAQKASAYSHLVHTNKMVDYWVFGLPVIASRLRALAELYGDEVIEYFEPGSAEDLARALRRLHDDPDRRRQLARNGRRAEARNGWGVQREAYLAPFRALAGAVPARASGNSTPRRREAVA